MQTTAARAFTALVLLVACAWTAFAQAELATITGTIKDPQAGILPGVTVSAVNVETNVTTTATSNAEGIYLLTSLVNGRYRVTFTLTGFSPVGRELEVRAGDEKHVRT